MDVEELRETTAAKISNRARTTAHSNWLMKELDNKQVGVDDEAAFLEMTTLAEFVFNSHYPVEGAFCYMTGASTWDVIFLLEAGYLQDLCIKFNLQFPRRYPDAAPAVRVAPPAVLINPMIDQATGEVDVPALLRDRWNGLENCTVHVLSAIKMMLMSPCQQPFQLTAESKTVNQDALNDYLESPNVTMKWRSIFIDSLRNTPAAMDESIIDETSMIDMYLNDLITGDGICRLPLNAATTIANYETTLQSHINIMLQRLRAPEPVSFLKLTQERVNIIHEDLNAIKAEEPSPPPPPLATPVAPPLPAATPPLAPPPPPAAAS